MGDPFRTNSNQQLIQEAKVGLTMVAILLSLFLYVAFYKITGRGKHIPDHVRDAPIAKQIWPDAPPKFDGMVVPATRLGQEIAAESSTAKRERPGFGPSSTDVERTRFNATRIPETDAPTKPVPSETKQQPGQFISQNRTPKSPEKPAPKPKRESTKNAISRIGNSVNGLLNSFGSRNNDKKNNPRLASNSDTRSHPNKVLIIDTSDNPAVNRAGNDESIQASWPRGNDLRPAQDISSASSSFQPNSFQTNEVKSKPSVQLTSAESSETDFSPKTGFGSKSSFNSDANLNPIPSSIEVSEPPHQPTKLKPRRIESGQFSPESSSIGDFQPLAHHGDTTGSRNSNSIAQMGKTNVLTPRVRSPQPIAVQTADQPKLVLTPFQADIARLTDRTETETPSAPHPASVHAGEKDQSLPTTYICAEGDSYWSIAEKIYQDGRYFRALYRHNESVNPTFELLPETVLSTPAKSDLRKLWPDQCPREKPKQADSPNLPTVTDHVYVTRENDTLFAIAAQKLNQASRYIEIYRLNESQLIRQVGPSTPLPAGVRLELPAH